MLRCALVTPGLVAVEGPIASGQGLGDVDRLLDRTDPLAELASAPSDTERFVTAVPPVAFGR